MESESDTLNVVPLPPGLKSLIEHCQGIYSDQPNPLQVTTILKYWLGGHDPLDYISMYFNKGDASKGIPPHWHYISFGLSDLHGDGRVHPTNMENSTRSGMGFELTFRLLFKENHIVSAKHRKPPTWPASLLQDIARYCFQTGNGLCVGDNIPWRKALDGSTSRLQHILVAEDPQLNSIKTPYGTVDFCQIVGVTEEELEHASCWNGKGVLNYLKEDLQTGGEWLITDMSRKQSVFELFPETLLNLKDDLEKQGSDLAGINAEFTFREIYAQIFKQELDSDTNKELNSCDENSDINLNNESKDVNLKFMRSMSVDNSLEKSYHAGDEPIDCVSLDGIEITLAPYAAKFLLLAIKDRVRHGRHFTFKSQNSALTFVAESVTGSAVNKKSPYGVLGYWVQVLITEESIPSMILAFQEFLDSDTKNKGCKEFDWPDINLKIIIRNP